MKPYLSRANHDTAVQYTGLDGQLLLDQDDQCLRLLDGTTPGGTVLGFRVGLTGPTEVGAETTVTYELSGVSSFSTATVTALYGNAVLNDTTITYTAPTGGNDELKITIDGVTRRFTIVVPEEVLTGSFTRLAGGPPATERSRMVTTNQGLYLLGGDDTPNIVWSFDPDSNTWTQHPNSLYTLGDGFAACGVGDTIYLYAVGGGNDLFVKYNTLTGDWISLGNIGKQVRYTTLVHHAGKLYTCGGWAGNNDPQESVLRVYDIADGSWNILAEGPARQAHQMVNVNDKLYIFSGDTKDADPSYQTDLWVYDIPTDVWTQHQDLPGHTLLGGQLATSGVIGSKIYGFGGRGDPSVRSDLWMIDTVMLEVSRIVDSGHDRDGPASTVYGGAFYIYGGKDSSTENKFYRVT